jgi:hypothetical protein
MPVVINDFEVVPGEATAPPATAEETEGGGDKKPLSDDEIARMVAHKISRDERVWAH